MTSLSILPLGLENEKLFLDFLHEDRSKHIFTIQDLRYSRDKTEIWIAFKDEKIVGYILVFDEEVVNIHGDGIPLLLKCIDLDEFILVIEPQHLTTVKAFFEPIGPSDGASKGDITTYLVMKVNAESFKPLIRHPVRRLETQDFDDVLRLFRSWNPENSDKMQKNVKRVFRSGFAYGAYENNSLVSVTTVPQIMDDLVFIRGAYTLPSLRRRGYSTSACSGLVKDVTNQSKEAMLWVARDNIPARKVYEKIGFITHQLLLGFKAKKNKD